METTSEHIFELMHEAKSSQTSGFRNTLDYMRANQRDQSIQELRRILEQKEENYTTYSHTK